MILFKIINFKKIMSTYNIYKFINYKHIYIYIYMNCVKHGLTTLIW